MNKILGFFHENRWLSNFWPCRIFHMRYPYDMEEFPNVEQAYQALKCEKDEDWNKFVRDKDKGPKWAKHLSYNITVKKDWPEIKLSVMGMLIRQKFSNANPELRQKLIDTKDAYIEETNTWNDVYWGVCKGGGENHLGKIIMEIRQEILDIERWTGSTCIGCGKEECNGDCPEYLKAEADIRKVNQ